MSSAKVSKLSTILHLHQVYQHDMLSSVGWMLTEFKQTSTSAKVYIDLIRRFRAVQVTAAWPRAMHSLVWHLSPRVNARQAARVAFRFSTTAATLSLAELSRLFILDDGRLRCTYQDANYTALAAPEHPT